MNGIEKNEKAKSASRLSKVFRDISLFCVGAFGYYGLEVLFRGYSHWSMALCGGLCLLSIYYMNRKLAKIKLAARALGGALIITAVELICGLIVNILLKWRVWDYSHMPMNLFGQICLPFTLLWFAMCIPICFVLGHLGNKTQN